MAYLHKQWDPFSALREFISESATRAEWGDDLPPQSETRSEDVARPTTEPAGSARGAGGPSARRRFAQATASARRS